MYQHDTRWSPTAGQAPPDAAAVYSARWIDHGDHFDVIPDRHGYAWTHDTDRQDLAEALAVADPARHTMIRHSDRYLPLYADPQPGDLDVRVRRTGGYVYVEAWITP